MLTYSEVESFIRHGMLAASAIVFSYANENVSNNDLIVFLSAACHCSTPSIKSEQFYYLVNERKKSTKKRWKRLKLLSNEYVLFV